jgi:hypothetical protein
LYKALTKNNIKKGFSATGIWPLNEHAVDNMLALSESFERPQGDFDMGVAQHHHHVGGQLHAQGHKNMLGNESAEGGQEGRSNDPLPVDPRHGQPNYQGTMMTRMTIKSTCAGMTKRTLMNSHKEGMGMGMGRAKTMVGTISTLQTWSWNFRLSLAPASSIILVTSDAADAQVTEEVGRLDPAVNELVSIKTFLTLPTVTR